MDLRLLIVLIAIAAGCSSADDEFQPQSFVNIPKVSPCGGNINNINNTTIDRPVSCLTAAATNNDTVAFINRFGLKLQSISDPMVSATLDADWCPSLLEATDDSFLIVTDHRRALPPISGNQADTAEILWVSADPGTLKVIDRVVLDGRIAAAVRHDGVVHVAISTSVGTTIHEHPIGGAVEPVGPKFTLGWRATAGQVLDGRMVLTNERNFCVVARDGLGCDLEEPSLGEPLVGRFALNNDVFAYLEPVEDPDGSRRYGAHVIDFSDANPGRSFVESERLSEPLLLSDSYLWGRTENDMVAYPTTAQSPQMSVGSVPDSSGLFTIPNSNRVIVSAGYETHLAESNGSGVSILDSLFLEGVRTATRAHGPEESGIWMQSLDGAKLALTTEQGFDVVLDSGPLTTREAIHISSDRALAIGPHGLSVADLGSGAVSHQDLRLPLEIVAAEQWIATKTALFEAGSKSFQYEIFQTDSNLDSPLAVVETKERSVAAANGDELAIVTVEDVGAPELEIWNIETLEDPRLTSRTELSRTPHTRIGTAPLELMGEFLVYGDDIIHRNGEVVSINWEFDRYLRVNDDYYLLSRDVDYEADEVRHSVRQLTPDGRALAAPVSVPGRLLNVEDSRAVSIGSVPGKRTYSTTNLYLLEWRSAGAAVLKSINLGPVASGAADSSIAAVVSDGFLTTYDIANNLRVINSVSVPESLVVVQVNDGTVLTRLAGDICSGSRSEQFIAFDAEELSSLQAFVTGDSSGYLKRPIPFPANNDIWAIDAFGQVVRVGQ